MHEKLILFCNCQARNESAIWKEAAETVEKQYVNQYITLTDLCGLCAEDTGKINELVDNAGQVLLIACHPRAAKMLLHDAGVVSTDKIRYVNLLEDDNSRLLQVTAEFMADIPEASRKHGYTLQQSDPSWPAWYPVIDHSRCNHCGQCADFCLFGVYRKSADMVEVANPENCKNNCPACARICPGIAIVFPKYAGGGAIGGSDGIDNKSEMQRLQQDTDAILGDDIYAALEQRKMKRRSIIREDTLQKAIRERNEALDQARAAEKKSGS